MVVYPRLALAVFAVCLSLCQSAFADDSTATLGAGGLVLVHDDNIRMATEDLYLSPVAVKVHYTFSNDSDHDIDAIVAFPLPDIDNAQFEESPMGTTVLNYPNFVGFKVMVNGKPVKTTLEEHALLKGRDVTAQVRAFKLPLSYAGSDLSDRLNGLSVAQRASLVKQGLAEDDGPQQLYPLWTATTKFWWHQVFPAQTTIAVDHTYQPVTGSSFFTGFVDPESMQNYRTTACVDNATEAAIRAKSQKISGMLNQTNTQFVIKTANNWKGPIGRFHLIVDKLKPENILSFCWPGTLNKISKTRFESTLSNFAPRSDIDLMVLTAPN
jgi:hypothetical protein